MWLQSKNKICNVQPPQVSTVFFVEKNQLILDMPISKEKIASFLAMKIFEILHLRTKKKNEKQS